MTMKDDLLRIPNVDVAMFAILSPSAVETLRI